MGRNGIPCIGFGPGAEAQAHAPNEKTWKQDLVTCAAVYAALPTVLLQVIQLFLTSLRVINHSELRFHRKFFKFRINLHNQKEDIRMDANITGLY